MKIEQHKVGVLAYSIQVEDAQGDVLEQASVSEPRTLVFGLGRLMQSFEDKLIGLKSGDKFEFLLTPEETFGVYKDEMVMDIPKTAFMINGELKADTLVLGKVVPMMDNHGNPFNGYITELKDDAVTMDFNHPLAGKSLYTVGEVLNVREATFEELNPAPSGGCGCGTPDDSCCGGGSKKEGHHHHHHGEGGCGSCETDVEVESCGSGSCNC
jgi:FKBP-type peptidyl-prolyl cis-trans isomerase SlyD